MTLHDVARQSALPPLGRATTQSDLVAAALREAILSGRFAPDALLVERKIAEQLGVSKTPVREALIQLGNSGLVTNTRSRGVRVRRVTMADARYVYEQRYLLEPWATAQVVASDHLDVTEAERFWAESRLLLEAEDWPAMAIVNRQFHRALYSQCENPMVVATLDAMQDLTALATLNVFWGLNPTAASEHEEHWAILRLAKARDGDAAAEEVRRHIGRNLERLKEKQADTD